MFVNRVLLHTTKREKYLQYGRLDKVQLYTYNISLVSTKSSTECTFEMEKITTPSVLVLEDV
jgi:hypothetical protein